MPDNGAYRASEQMGAHHLHPTKRVVDISHIMEYTLYGFDFLLELGFSREDYCIISELSQPSVCSQPHSRSSAPHNQRSPRLCIACDAMIAVALAESGQPIRDFWRITQCRTLTIVQLTHSLHRQQTSHNTVSSTFLADRVELSASGGGVSLITIPYPTAARGRYSLLVSFPNCLTSSSE